MLFTWGMHIAGEFRVVVSAEKHASTQGHVFPEVAHIDGHYVRQSSLTPRFYLTQIFFTGQNLKISICLT